MTQGWRYRITSALSVASIMFVAVWLANAGPVRAGFRMLPVVSHLPFYAALGTEFALEASTTAVVLLVALVPLYKPRPRRILDTAELAVRRVLLACIALAAIGYFDYTYLLLTMPTWFVAIRQQPRGGGDRTIIVGDDPDTMADILRSVEGAVLGYVSPPSAYFEAEAPQISEPRVADGGAADVSLDELACLGGLSRLDEVLVEYDVDTAVLAFARPDRAEFFGTLDECYEHGVAAEVHRQHADVVLTTGVGKGELIDIDLEPWDWLDRILKRAFDITFAVTALVGLAPATLLIAGAVKFEDCGPILYRQNRTAAFGDTFTVRKFRSMIPDAESETGVTLSEEDAGGVDPRVTRVGRVLRQTHLDEIPQLWSVLIGDMSVVGPRPERPELDQDIEKGVGEWRSRWFVKPGLTGLAQVNDATGYDPEQKLQYDIEYIRKQSFWFDLKIVIRQI
jgi:lipopolysaccharide/colanic/teichoic acid biosynthesis glycosyltransferase